MSAYPVGRTRRLVVVKVGTSSLTCDDGSLNLREMERLVDQIAQAVEKGVKIVLVTSGAVASGMAELKVRFNPNDIVFKQACAATGQSILMAHYREFFKRHGLKVAQILLTKEDLSNRVSYTHTCNVLDKLLQVGVVPIINENDATSIDELKPITKGYEVNFSDNDILSVLIANAIQAELVILLSNVEGLYTMNPKSPEAKLIPLVERVTPELKISVDGKSPLGRGGMKTKLQAAEIAMRSGITVVIANSFRERVLLDVLSGKPLGTWFKPTDRMSGIKKWLTYGASLKGRIVVNEGAERAIIRGSSLLPIGVSEISGQFDVGDVVSLVCQDGKKFGRGMVNYSSDEVNLIKGLKTSQVSKVLGYIREKEIVTRKRVNLFEEEGK
ncbi:MAG: glutamate 5-kinase [Candidatus Bathyarchaeota archaeon]